MSTHTLFEIRRARQTPRRSVFTEIEEGGVNSNINISYLCPNRHQIPKSRSSCSITRRDSPQDLHNVKFPLSIVLEIESCSCLIQHPQCSSARRYGLNEALDQSGGRKNSALWLTHVSDFCVFRRCTEIEKDERNC